MIEIERLADAHGDRPAIESNGRSVSYVELASRVARALRELAAAGVRPGQRIAGVCPQEEEAIPWILASLERGCAILPLGTDLRDAEISRQATAFHAEWVGRPGKELAKVGAGSPAAREPDDRGPVARGLLSSGSSGVPRLACFGPRELAARITSYQETVALESGDRVLGVVSLAHGHGFDHVLLATLAAGACLVVPHALHPREVALQIARDGITLFSAPPSFLDLMVRAARGRVQRLATLRRCHSVGDVLSRRVFEAFAETFGVAPWQSYGASEAGGVLLNRTGALREGVLALGRPYQGVAVELWSEAGRPSREGEIGEILVRSPGVAFDRPADDGGTGAIVDGCFHSGDLAVLRGGDIHFAGRRKLLIAVAGRKVNPQEVEEALCRHPAVVEAAVVARSEAGREGVTAFVVTSMPVQERELLEFCGRALAPYKVPRRIELREELPRNPAGKLMRHQLA